ncbi:MAG: Poly(3-hydroxyalkanoate) depolymerase [uncultured Sphingosinicella sp.]|uniref:Poly(3-hydroxyalkanoate) depolymerase n=1 Tax=uncultured Sphingosinicella sp. TaxID=478748 RepID=A0A6J4TE50_9SPHN|nr:PHB depolymerase family esterase [uncultured Sphingosinicella sp.]CAA9521381.1 MAG: Poly(3-hydroxyalkanoate) depolymerase [uncultured Sphingosinicella sp.]
MRVSDTIMRLRAARAAPAFASGDDRLTDLAAFSPNPGNLRARIYLPEGLAEGAPLVVVLHGCTQTAALYDEGSGWSRLADRHGFAVLFPEQQRSNNPNLCFNWFQPSDTRRGSGEAASIQAMVAEMVDAHGIDPQRVYVTGLSAGGAMASAMLASYPDVFAAGAIIAGIAYGCAGSVGEAFECMAGGGREGGTALGDNVRRASDHNGPWPRVSVWHGDADRTVSSVNGDDVVKQWLDVHGIGTKPSIEEQVDGYPHRIWAGADGRPLVEQYVITGMGHGTPLDPGQDAGQSGQAGPHMLDVAISSTDRIAAFFGIAQSTARPKAAAGKRKPNATARAAKQHQAPQPGSEVQDVIESALRAAGLMR